jgi:hypothetical protein
MMEIDKGENIKAEGKKIPPQKPFDLIVWETKQRIIGALDNSGLPISVKTYILKEIFELSNATLIEYLNSLNIRTVKPLPEKE